MKYLNFILAFQLLFSPAVFAQVNAEPPQSDSVQRTQTTTVSALPNIEGIREVPINTPAAFVQKVETLKLKVIRNNSFTEATERMIQRIAENTRDIKAETTVICKTLGDLFREDPDQNPNDLLRAYETQVQRNLDDQKFVQMSLIMTRTIERYTTTDCSSFMKSCEVPALAKSNRFEKSCAMVAPNLLIPVSSLDKEFKNDLELKDMELSSSDWEPEEIVTIKGNGQKTCLGLGDGNCIFFQEEKFNEGCNDLECTAAGNSPVGEDLSEVASDLVNFYKTDWTPKGTPNFCVECLGKSYEALSGSKAPFKSARKTLEKQVERSLSGKESGQRLFDAIGEVENILNSQYLNADKKITGAGCLDSIKSIFSVEANPCDGEIDVEEFKKRANIALGEVKLNFRIGDPASSLVDEIVQKVDLKQGEHSCRNALASKKKLDYYRGDNRKYVSALTFVLNKGKESPGMQEILDSENCSKNGSSRAPFKTYLAKTLASDLMEKTNEIIRKNYQRLEKVRPLTMKNVDGQIHDLLCGSDDTLVNKVLCAKAGGHLGEVFGGALGKIAESREKFLEKKYPETYNELKTGMDPEWVHSYFQNEMKSMQKHAEKLYQTEFENIIALGMKMDPALRGNLGSWEAACSLYAKTKTIEAPLMGLARDAVLPPRAKDIEQRINASCGESVGRLKNALCKSNFLRAQGEGNVGGLGYSKADFGHALDSVLGPNSAPDKNLLGRSLSCEVLSQPTNLGRLEKDLYSVENKTGRASGLLSGWSDYKRDLIAEETANSHAALPRGLSQAIMQEGSCDPQIYQEALSLTSTESKEDYKEFTEGQRAVVQATSRAMNSQPGLGEMTESFPPSFFDPSGGGGKFSSSIHNTSSSTRIAESSDIPGQASRSISSEGLPEAVGSSSETNSNAIGSVNDTPIDPIGADSTKEVTRPQSYFSPSEISQQISDDDFEQALSEPNKEKAAEDLMAKAGASSDPEVKQMLKELLERQEKDSTVEDLRRQIEENKKEAEERYAALEEKLKAKEAIIKDKAGSKKGETTDIKGLASNNKYIVDTRAPGHKDAPVEFVDRTKYTTGPGKASISPDFSENSAPKRMTLDEYSTQRRASASARMPTEANRVNQEANRAFFKSFDSAAFSREDGTIDYGSYAKKYVAHLAKSPGTIEHLVIYDSNGRPEKIRVPDPKNHEKFMEVEIPEDLKEEILAQVQKDEVESYSLYEQTQGIFSVLDFMKNEKEKITSYENLLGMMEQADSLKQ